ncbi:MAG: glycosyltransferase family 2 protein [Muribaculaceae bacterium]|nr:glycosyltransferase family 2 protein [Muribaculaceae bacterium]MDE6682760.1 glycosyltransferase family 2 protein [Muribaculaceae bacterium]
MVSVCLATYNGERYLREQIDSILAQLREEDELIVSDDGSTDATKEILSSYSDSRIKLFSNEGNHGVNSNFENAVSHASGDYIFLSDQDDVWLPGKVEECVRALGAADCVVHDCIVTDGSGQVMEESFFSMRGSHPGFWRNLYRNSYLGCCMAFRKEVLKYALPYPDPLPVFQEGWIASLADIKGRVVFIPFKGILFRRHGNNASATAGKSSFGFGKQLSYRLKLLWLVGKRLIHIG